MGKKTNIVSINKNKTILNVFGFKNFFKFIIFYYSRKFIIFAKKEK